MKFKPYYILILLVLVLGLHLRIHNYTTDPPRGSSSDEYTYTFMGISLLKTGVPTTWSNFPVYEKYAKRQAVTIDKIFFPLVTPYFDHPPLNGILTGGWALLRGEDTFQKVTTGTIRQVPIFLSVITSILLFFIASHLFGKKSAFWALLIFSTSTIIVMQTRFVFAENLVTPLFLGSILLLLKTKKGKISRIFLLALFSGLAFWAKELGIAIYISILLLMIHQKYKFKNMIIYSIVSIFIMCLYLLYGYFYNWDLFYAIVFAQGSREVGPNTLNMLFFNPIIVNKQYFDGWYYFGFVSFFSSFFNLERYKTVLIPSFVYFFLMLFSLTSHGEMGWYMIPMFPFFCILSADLLVTSIKNKGGYILIASLFVGFYIIRYYYEAKFGLPIPVFRFLLTLSLIPLLAAFVLKKDTIYKFISNLWFYGLIVMTIYITFYYIHPL